MHLKIHKVYIFSITYGNQITRKCCLQEHICVMVEKQHEISRAVAVYVCMSSLCLCCDVCVVAQMALHSVSAVSLMTDPLDSVKTTRRETFRARMQNRSINFHVPVKSQISSRTSEELVERGEFMMFIFYHHYPRAFRGNSAYVPNRHNYLQLI